MPGLQIPGPLNCYSMVFAGALFGTRGRKDLKFCRRSVIRTISLWSRNGRDTENTENRKCHRKATKTAKTDSFRQKAIKETKI